MATQTVNIPRSVTDPFYRYKMEKLQSKIEGKGNGIKSVIVNLSSIATSLARPPVYVVKFFGFELGAQTNTGSDDRWIINGAHEAAKLQDYLDNFINKFVLCKECKNPETDLSVSKDQQVIRNCKACGRRTTVDPRHKLTSYILKNPPQSAREKKSKGDKKDKKNRSASQDADKEGSNSEEDAQNGNGTQVPQATSNLDQYAGDAGSDDELTRRIREEANALPTADGSGDAKTDEWALDMSKEAIAARAKDLPTDLKRSLVLGDDDDEDGEGEGGSTPYDELGQWIETEKEKNGSVNDVEIFAKASELGIEKKHKTLTVLAQTLFSKDIVKEVSQHAGLLKKLCAGSDRHQRAFLGGLERFIGKEHPELIASVPKILHQFYDQDVLEEEPIQKWGSRASKKYVDTATSKKVRKAAEPFLKWLEEADEDDSDEEEEEDDE